MSFVQGQPILSQVLTALVAIGWVVLIMTGIEPDKPLSGGIPGHIEPGDRACATRGCLADRIGEAGGWLIFAAASLSLPAILIWVVAAH